jgi:lipoprotein-releasing system permease protein
MQFLFAWRYLKAKKSTNAINIISWITMVVIAVVTWAMVVVLSVFNGFEGLVQSLYGDFFADIKIEPAQGKVMQLSPSQIATIKANSGVATFSGAVEEKVMLKNDEAQANAVIKGVEPAYQQTAGVAKHILHGNFDLGDTTNPKLLLGAGVENAIQVLADKNLLPITFYIPNGKAQTKADAIRSYNVGTCGSFVIQQEFDNKYAITNIDFMRYMLDLQPNEFSNADVFVRNPEKTDAIKEQLQAQLGNQYILSTRYEQNKSLFNVMRMEKWIIFCVLCIILIVAAFNMVGALTMLVLEKQKDIDTLKAIGATNDYVLGIFLRQGLLLALIGGVIGAVLGFLTCKAQQVFHLIKLGQGSFVIDHYPVEMQWFDFLLVSITVLVIALIASWLPAKKAAAKQMELK